MSTLAGSTEGGGYSDGPRNGARFSRPISVVFDSSGNLFVSDASNQVIRRISPSGEVSTFAGQVGVAGSSDGSGVSARFNSPGGIAIDPITQSLIVADVNNHTIRRISPSGNVTTLAGLALAAGTSDGRESSARFSFPIGVAVDAAGQIFVADTSNHAIRRITPLGDVTTLAGEKRSSGSEDGFGAQAHFNFPFDVSTDSVGNVFVADTDNHTVRKVTPDGRVTTVAGLAGEEGTADGIGVAARFSFPWGVEVDHAGNVFVSDTRNERIRRIAPDGSVITLAGSSYGGVDGIGASARFAAPTGLAISSSGTLFIADIENHAIRTVSATFQVGTFAGSMPRSGSTNGTGESARFFFPNGIATASDGTAYVTETNHTIRRISPGGVVTTLAGSPGQRGSADGLGSAARFNFPTGIALAPSGNLYVSDTLNHVIRKVTQSGAVTTFAGLPGSAGSSDGSGSQARFTEPWGLVCDGAGNVFVADSGNHAIRLIEPAGVVTRFAGSLLPGSSDGIGVVSSFRYPTGVAIDASRNLYVSDWGNHVIRRITPTGSVTTYAGGSGIAGTADGGRQAARFNNPYGIAVDGLGDIYVADTDNHAVRRIAVATGNVSTIVGSLPGNVDGVTGIARVYWPEAVAVNQSNEVLVADTYNHAIRKASTCVPMITAPQGGSAYTGQSWLFEVSLISGHSPVTYQWFEITPSGNSAPLGSSGLPTLKVIQIDHSYTVFVRATNECGSIDSARATVVHLGRAPRRRASGK